MNKFSPRQRWVRSAPLSLWFIALVAPSCDNPPAPVTPQAPATTERSEPPATQAPPETASSAAPPPTAPVAPTAPAIAGIVPYWNNLPRTPVHPPKTIYLNVYWADLQPSTGAPLDPASLTQIIETRLTRKLDGSAPIALRFIATGDTEAYNNPSDPRGRPLPSWFPKGWRADKKCETEKGQQLPSWTPEQVKEHERLVRALGAALDGHPGIAWVEPGSYGFWGEGHLDGAPKVCLQDIKTRKALARPWVDSFRKTSLSVTMDWLRTKDDPNHQLLALWSSAASVGLRFDCLGFSHDEVREVVGTLDQNAKSGWSGPWGGEFCYQEKGAQWSVGLLNKPEKSWETPPSVKKMNGTQRSERVTGVIRACGWSYVAGAGSSLLEPANALAGKALEQAMGTTRDLKACFKALSD